MKFMKYPSIENIEVTPTVDRVINNGGTEEHVEWVAREKLHGTNFAFYCDGNNVACAKRTDFIKWGEDFYNYRLIKRRYTNKICKVFANTQSTDQIIVYGEYAGNGIQKHIDYGKQDFYVFDIVVDGKFLDDDVVSEICESVGLKQAPLLKRGTFEEVNQIDREMLSVVSISDDIAEGYVIKPNKTEFFNSGRRVIFKCKSAKFKEKGKPRKLNKNNPKLTSTDKELLESLTAYITENRLSNVLSHIGNVTNKDFGRICGLMSQDVLEDAEKDGIYISKADNQSLLKKELFNEISTFIRPTFHQNVLITFSTGS